MAGADRVAVLTPTLIANGPAINRQPSPPSVEHPGLRLPGRGESGLVGAVPPPPAASGRPSDTAALPRLAVTARPW